MRKTASTQTLATLPAEILDNIFQHLRQKDLHSLMLTNSNFIEIAASYMYIAPYFATTYRYAQFAYTVGHKEHYAGMVRVLDLSYFARGADEQGEVEAQAGWREFKYRHHDMYYARDRMAALSAGPKTIASSHPQPSPFLKSFHRTRDVPIGGVCHALAACKRIRKVNLSRLQLASDFLVSSPLFPSTSTTSLIFVSDVPKSWTWHSNNLLPVYADYIISFLTRLDCLESFKAKNCLWLTTARVDRLMREAGTRLEKVDFRESGMQRDVRWAIRSQREVVRRIVGEVVANTKDAT